MADVFINEFHYDNTGTDTGEFVEVAGPAGADLTGWTIVHYNGNGGTIIATQSLSGIIANQNGTGFGTISIAFVPLQNDNEGLALVDDNGVVVEFLAYEGTVTATAGPAAGMTATSVGAEPSSAPVGSSLTRQGTGTESGDFSFVYLAAGATPGQLNTGQTIRNDVAGDGTSQELFGTQFRDSILAGAGDDTVFGSAGNDTLDGGDGADTVDYTLLSAGVSVDLNVSVAQTIQPGKVDTLTGFERVRGSEFNDVLTGTSGDNNLAGFGANDSILGGDGLDRVRGGAGDDTLDGGAGLNDIVDYALATAGVTVDLRVTEAQATVGEGSDVLSNFESLFGSELADTLTGTDGANRLGGRAGADSLNGLAGADTLTGSEGDDTLSGGDDADRLLGGDDDDDLLGGLGVDTLLGELGDDDLQGEGGADRLFGGAGDDTIAGGADGDLLAGETGNDDLNGGAGVDRLLGGGGADALNGGGDGDVLVGGLGSDTLTGSAGRDVFVFESVDDSPAVDVDFITDFSRADRDRIRLDAIDANTENGAGDDAFTFIGSEAFSGTGTPSSADAGQLRVTAVGEGFRVEGDTDGDGDADIVFDVASITQLTAADFIL